MIADVLQQRIIKPSITSPVSDTFFLIFLKIFLKFIYLTERQPAREGMLAGGVGEEEAGSQQKSLMWGSIPDHRDHALS